MANAPKKPVIPPVLRATKEVVQFAEKTREAVGVLQGQRGNTLDRAVTFRDVEGENFLKDLREGFRGIGGVPTEQDTDFTVPPIPTGFTGRAGFEYAVLSWDEPTYSNHAYTEIYWSDTDNISVATKYGNAFGVASVFLVDMDTDTTKYFWIRFVSTAGVEGQYSSTSGLQLTTAIDVTAVLTALTDEIREDQLFSDLADRIDLIDGSSSLTGSVNARIAAETAARNSAVASLQSSIADLEGLSDWANGTSYAIDDLVKYDGSIYKCIQATSSVVPTNTSYWDEIGEYDSLGGAVAANASDISDIDSRVTTAEGNITSTSSSLTALSATVNDSTTGLSSKASSAALTQAVSDIYGSQVSQFTNIDAQFTSVNNSLNSKASINQLNQAKTDIYGSAVSQFTNIDAQFTSVNSSLAGKATSVDLTNAVANIYGAQVTAFTNIDAKFDSVDTAVAARATIASLNSAVSNIYSSQVSQFTNIQARFDDVDDDLALKAGITQMNTAIAAGDSSAVATATQQVYTTLGGANADAAYVQTQAASWDGAGARWTTKTQVGDLVGGIGILNDGTSTRLYVQADRFAIYDSSLPSNTSDLVPFVVTGGKTFIKSAAIQDATIEVAKIKDGFLDDLTAAKGTLAQARIGTGDIFNLTIGDQISSSNYSLGTSGWKIQRDGTVEFNGGTFRGAVRFLSSTDQANARSDLNVANGADVTANNTAASIAGQGALATSNTADFATQVSGSGKPALNADVTSQNTAADTALVAGTSASSVRDQASAGAYANTRVSSWTRPTSTLIDGNKIFTGDAYVDTLQIKGNAVIVPAYDDLSVSSIAPNWPNWKTPVHGLPEVSVTLDVASNVVIAWFTRTNPQASGAGDFQIRIYRGSTQIQYIGSVNSGAVHSGTIQQSLSAGTHTFSMQIRSYNGTLYDASILVLGVQR